MIDWKELSYIEIANPKAKWKFLVKKDITITLVSSNRFEIAVNRGGLQNIEHIGPELKEACDLQFGKPKKFKLTEIE